MTVHLRCRAEQTIREFETGHFEAYEQGGLFGADGDVLGDVHREGGFPHTGAGGEDDQFRVVQAAAERVEIGEARLHAAQGVLMLHPRVHADHHLLQHCLDRFGLRRTAVLEDLEDLRLCPRHQFPRFVGGVVGVAQDVGARVDE